MIVELYGKPGCHLCDRVREELEEMREVVPFAIHEVDITSDPALQARYRYDIPVVVVGGRELARHRIEDPGAFEKMLGRLASEGG